MPAPPCQPLHLFEQRAPWPLRRFIMTEDYAGPLGQIGDARQHVGHARIGHQPDFGKRVAAAHIAAYSAAMTDPETRLTTVQAAMAKAAKLANRAPDATTLIAISKTRSADDITPLIAAGQRDFGENRVQEAHAKWPALRAAHPDVRLHLVGQLQSNKADEAVALFDVIHSVDRPSLITALAKAQEKSGRHPACFLQVNIGDEDQKGGCAVADVPALLAAARAAGLDIVGLMAVPPADIEAAPFFALLAKLARDHGLPQLSMGMSGDFETAIMLSATYVRVGTALFGARA
jgi:PLP dependent protein